MGFARAVLLCLVVLPITVHSQEVEIIANATDYRNGIDGISGSPYGFAVSATYQPVTGTIPCDESRFALLDLSLTPTRGMTDAIGICPTYLSTDVAFQTTGDFLFTGLSYLGGAARTTVARLFDRYGDALTGPIQIGDPTSTTPDWDPQVVALQNGSYAVVWHYFSGVVLGRIVAADGSLPGTVVPMLPLAGAVRIGPVGNRLAVGWQIPRLKLSEPDLIQFQMFDETLAPVTPVVTVASVAYPDGAGMESLAGYPGGFLLSWYRWFGQTAQDDVYARYFDPSGKAQGPELRVNTFLPDRQEGTQLATDKTGLALAVWTSRKQDPGDPYYDSVGVYGQLLVPPGDKLGSEFRVNTTTAGRQVTDLLYENGVTPAGGFVTTWWNTPPNQTEKDIQARRYFFPVSLAVGPGPDPGAPPNVRTFRPMGRPGYAGFAPYASPGYGADVAAGGIDGTSIDAILTGPGPGPVLGPHLRAFRPDGTPIAKVSLYAYGTLRYGFHPAAGDTDGDGFAEILTGAGSGAVFGPQVRAFDYDGATVVPIKRANFYAYGSLRYGVKTSSGDIDGDKTDEILTAPGPGPSFSPNIRAFKDYRPMAGINFTAAGGFGGEVAAGDIESDGYGVFGDGYDEIITASGPDPNIQSEFSVWDYDNASLRFKAVYQPAPSYYGATVAAGDADAGDMDEIAAGTGPDPAAPGRVQLFEWEPQIWKNPDPPHLDPLGPDDFIARSTGYGVRLAIGKFE